MILPLDTFEFLDRAARLYGQKPSVVDQDKKFTYSELLSRSNAITGAVQSMQLKKLDVVSILSYNSHHMLECYYGLLRPGLIINPLNFRYSSEDIAYMINVAQSKAVMVHRDFLRSIESIRDKIPSVKHIVTIEGMQDRLEGDGYHSYEELIAAHQGQPKTTGFESQVNENEIAELLFTSGTTRRPKAVALTHRNLYLNALYTIIAYRLTDDDVLLHVVPLFHANGGGTPQTITAVGGKHVMLRKVDPEIMLSLIEKEDVTMFVAVPTVVNRILSHPKFESFDTSSMRRIIVIGTATTPELIHSIETRMPGCKCISAYGMTETGPLVAVARPKSHEKMLPSDEQLRLRTMTGYEILGVNMRVMDENMREVRPDGETEGEIAVRGNSIFNGYLGNNDYTSEAIVDGWFRTGDVGVMHEGGYVRMMDRSKDMIKSGGENISSVEVEEVLAQHPDVSEVAVIAVPDNRWGEVPKALVMRKPSKLATEVELINYCRDHMAHFKAPKSVEFVESFPRTVTGKILKSKLRERFWKGYERRIH